MSSRSYPVPARISVAVDGDGPLARRVREGRSLSTDDLNRAAVIAAGTPLGEWAQQILRNEQAVVLDAFLPDDRLPMGVLASGTDDDIIVALSLGDRVFTASGWTEEKVDTSFLMELDEETVVAVAEALTSGADGLVLRPWVPLAIISAAPAPAPQAKPKEPPRPGQKVDQPASAPTGDAKPLTPQQASKTDTPEPETTTELETQDTPPEGAEDSDVPEGAKVVAVVDDLDKTAVIELLAVAPGPKVYRRNDGSWTEDPQWVTNLRSVKPPPLVQLTDPAQIEDVVAQVDEATKGVPFDPKAAGKEPSPDEPGPEKGQEAPPAEEAGKEQKPVTASAEWASEHQRRADEFATQLALVAASKAGAKVKGKATGAEKLRQYWLHGEGALKIRWGTKGDWKRCVRHLSKYMGPRAAGYCQLMHARATGSYTGDKIHRKSHGTMTSHNPATKAEAIAKQLSH